METAEAVIASVRETHARDARVAIFEIEHEWRDGCLTLRGQTTEPGAAAAAFQRLAELHPGATIVDAVVRLPAPELGSVSQALVRAAVAPVYAAPRVSATQITQYMLGQRLELLSRDGPWFRVRGEDAYLGWVHQGTFKAGSARWALRWEQGDGGEPAIALGAELLDEEDRIVARLPWGARVVGSTPTRYRLPDGRQGTLGSGEIIAADRLPDRFPPRGESLVRTARRWLGSPYVWGGVTPWGTDCSGFVQSIFRLHGFTLPRDSDMQANLGVPIETSGDPRKLQPGDLLFFAETPGRISHVAIALGGGHIIHAALSNGGVAEDDLTADGDVPRTLRSIFVEARRLLPES